MSDKTEKKSKQTLIIMVIVSISLISIGAYAVISSKGIDLKNIFSPKPDNLAKINIPDAAPDKPANKTPEFDYVSFSKAELSVNGLINSSDIYTIKKALDEIQGIEKVLIDIQTGFADVFFDEALLQNTDIIAETIKEKSGFEAQVTKVLAKNELSDDDNYNKKITKLYAATVNDFDISIADYNKEVKMYKSQYKKRYGNDVFTSSQSGQLYENIKAQSMMALIDDAALRTSISKSDYIITDEVIDNEITAMLSANSISLQDAAKSNGYTDKDYFYKKLETQVLIQHYAEDKLFEPTTPNEQKGLLFNKWVADCKSYCETKYYNSGLQDAVAKAKACGIDGCGDPTCN